ncbi:hypothetical protein [Pelagibius sp. 7325]|uniref:hypothetical protein n=1 Tax=Pelagibius sp. 7325 TaxID=3131994 RepID=UPI0030EC902C
MDWKPGWVLPNIEIDKAIDTEYFALAPTSDPRVKKLKKQHPEFREFIGSFRDSFKNRLRPAVILTRDDAPKRLKTVDAVGGFRDILAASTVPKANAENTIYDGGRDRIGYSSAFSVYPWALTTNLDHIVALTPAFLGVHEARAFQGQSSPELPPVRASRRDFDFPLFRALQERWLGRFNAASPAWSDIALFRSLNMANQAMMIPGGTDATIHHFGRTISFWVSAFEILVHPGGDGRANLNKVFELLENAPWIEKRCRHRLYETGTKNKKARRNLACWLYRELNNRRNDFLHGNPVTRASLRVPYSGRGLIYVAPVLYRLGLTSFLGLSWNREVPAPENADQFAQYITEHSEFHSPQKDAERALLMARISVDEARRQRRQRIEETRRRRRKHQQ